MGLIGAILGGIGAIAAAIGVIVILEVSDTPILSDKLTWGFWFAVSVILFLAAISFLLGRGQNRD